MRVYLIKDRWSHHWKCTIKSTDGKHIIAIKKSQSPNELLKWAYMVD